MAESILAQVKQLDSMTVPQLREKWLEVFGRETKQRHRRYLIKRIAWKLQEDLYGGVPPEVQARIDELRQECEDSDPKTWFPMAHHNVEKRQRQLKAGIRDRRLPPPGAALTRDYKGHRLTVTVLDGGFEYEGRFFRSLSAVAREVTGSHISGPAFFGLTRKQGQ